VLVRPSWKRQVSWEILKWIVVAVYCVEPIFFLGFILFPNRSALVSTCIDYKFNILSPHPTGRMRYLMLQYRFPCTVGHPWVAYLSCFSDICLLLGRYKNMKPKESQNLDTGCMRSIGAFTICWTQLSLINFESCCSTNWGYQGS
jgi:hypothetical protein